MPPASTVTSAGDTWGTAEMLAIVKSFLNFRQTCNKPDLVFSMDMDRTVWDRIHDETKWPSNVQYDKRYSFCRMHFLTTKLRIYIPQYLVQSLQTQGYPIHDTSKHTMHTWASEEWKALLEAFRHFRTCNPELGEAFCNETHLYESANIFAGVVSQHSHLTIAKCSSKMIQLSFDLATDGRLQQLKSFSKSIKYAIQNKLFKNFHPSVVSLAGLDVCPTPTPARAAKRPAPSESDHVFEIEKSIKKPYVPPPRDKVPHQILRTMNEPEQPIEPTVASSGLTEAIPTSFDVGHSSGDFSAVLIREQQKLIQRFTTRQQQMGERLRVQTEHIQTLTEEIERLRQVASHDDGHRNTTQLNQEHLLPVDVPKIHSMAPTGMLLERNFCINKHVATVICTNLSPSEVSNYKSRLVMAPIYVQSTFDKSKLVPIFCEIDMAKLLDADKDAVREERSIWVIE